MARCDQCEAMMINGIFCHETGCPNKKYRPQVKKREKHSLPKPNWRDTSIEAVIASNKSSKGGL